MLSKPLKRVPERFKRYQPEFGTLRYKIYWFVRWEIIGNIASFFRRYKKRVSRSLAYAKFGWTHYDFDSIFIWDLLEFKLKRIRKCLQNGVAYQTKEDMKALDNAIKLANRLYSERYEDKYLNLHDKKWGKIRHKRIPVKNEKGEITHYNLKSSRANVKTEKDRELERKSFLEAYKLGDKDRNKDLDELNRFFKKTLRNLWD